MDEDIRQTIYQLYEKTLQAVEHGMTPKKNTSPKHDSLFDNSKDESILTIRSRVHDSSAPRRKADAISSVKVPPVAPRNNAPFPPASPALPHSASSIYTVKSSIQLVEPTQEPELVTPWAVIARELRARDLPVEEVDRTLYRELIAMPKQRVLRKLDYLKRHGDLEHKRALRLAVNNIQDRTAADMFYYSGPRVESQSALYAKRFTHQEPVGKVPTQSSVDFFWSRQHARSSSLTKTKAKVQKAHRACGKSILKWGALGLLILGITATIVLLVYFKVLKVDVNNGPSV